MSAFPLPRGDQVADDGALVRDIAGLAEERQSRQSALVTLIHDEVLQMIGLCGVKMDLALALLTDGKKERGRREVASAREALHAAADCLREIMADWHPYLVEVQPLVDAIDDYLAQVTTIYGIETSRIGEPAAGLARRSKTLLYCYLQSLISVLVRASQPQTIEVEFSADALVVTVVPGANSSGGITGDGALDWPPQAAWAYARALGGTIVYSGHPANSVVLALSLPAGAG